MKTTKRYVAAVCLVLAAALCLPLMGCSEEKIGVSDLTIEFVRGIQHPVTIYWMCYNKETSQPTKHGRNA